MIDDVRLAGAMRDVASQVHPPADAVDAIVRGARRRRRMRAAVTGVSAAGAAAAVALTVSFSLNAASGDHRPATLAADQPTANVESLTGKAVGDALGLTAEPIQRDMGCNFYSQYDGTMGFCLDSLHVSDTERHLLGAQILGFPRTPALTEYVDVQLQLQQMSSVPDDEKDWHAIVALNDRLKALMSEMTAERVPN